MSETTAWPEPAAAGSDRPAGAGPPPGAAARGGPGVLGRRYGEAGHVADVRLECHGLDRDDNGFVIGLVGRQLHPLSRLVKDMRSTRQTSEFIQKMGPFFVGRALYQSPLPAREGRETFRRPRQTNINSAASMRPAREGRETSSS